MSADAPGQDAGYRVALPEFEGPLDLLLHLCKTHEIEVVNLPVAFITEKYLEYLEVMQSLSVDVAADYLLMAATLAYLKARELVPSPEPVDLGEDEEGEVVDPREALIRQLLQYQKYKDAAEKLGQQPIEGRTVFPRGATLAGEGDAGGELAEHSAWKLIEAFGRILEKAGPRLTHDVVVDRVSISERINELVDKLEAGGGVLRFDACFDFSLPEAELRGQVVVTLLAMLELARLKVVRVLQARDEETLYIARVEGADLAGARRVQVTSVTEGEAEGAAASAESPADDASVEPGSDDGAPQGDDHDGPT